MLQVKSVKAELFPSVTVTRTFDVPNVVAVPEIKPVATTPYVRFETSFPSDPAAASYEIALSEKPNGKSVRTWSVSLPADAAANGKIVYTMPDLSAIAGWSSGWILPGTRVDVVASLYEAKIALSDGTTERVRRRTTCYQPE